MTHKQEQSEGDTLEPVRPCSALPSAATSMEMATAAPRVPKLQAAAWQRMWAILLAPVGTEGDGSGGDIAEAG